MRSSTRARVVKSHAVEVSIPRLVECRTTGFEHLGDHLAVVKDTGAPEEEKAVRHSLNQKTHEIPDASEQFLDWESEGFQIIDQARIQAQEILARAEAEALEIRKKAEQEIARLKEQVREEVFQQARSEGFSQGYAEGKRQGEEEGKQLLANANRLFLLAQKALQEEYVKVDAELLHLAIKIAERILRATLSIEPHRLLDIIRGIILLPQEREGWRLHLAPEDAEWIMALPPDEQPPCILVKDEILKPGDCYLECEEGIFEARLEAQLDKLEQLLQEEMKNERLDQAGG